MENEQDTNVTLDTQITFAEIYSVLYALGVRDISLVGDDFVYDSLDATTFCDWVMEMIEAERKKGGDV